MLARIQTITVGQALSWWRHELASMMPRKLLRVFGGGRKRTVLIVDGETVALEQDGQHVVMVQVTDRDGKLKAEGDARAVKHALRASDKMVDLQLPETRLLKTTLTVPAGELIHARQFIERRMDRITPFQPEDVVFDYKVSGGNIDSNNVRLDVYVAKRYEVAAALARARMLGGIVTRVTGVGLSDMEYINLLGSSDRARPQSVLATSNRALLAIAVIGTFFIYGIELWRKHAELRASEAVVATLRDEARTAVDIEDRINAMQGQVAALVAARSADRSTTALLAELTRRLPDDTWLEELVVRDGKVAITGFSRGIPEVLEQLETSQWFSAARLSAPLARDSGGRGERFRIEATLSDIQEGGTQ